MSGQPESEAWGAVGKICHDLNNVVTVVRGLCDLILMDHASDKDLCADVQEIRDNATRATELIERLHAMAAEHREY